MENLAASAHALVHAINDISPLGLCGGLAYIIYLIVSKKGPVRMLSDNHLSDLPKMARSLVEIASSQSTLVASSARQETTLAAVRDGINEVKGRLHG